jgi:hypothetical protein
MMPVSVKPLQNISSIGCTNTHWFYITFHMTESNDQGEMKEGSIIYSGFYFGNVIEFETRAHV